MWTEDRLDAQADKVQALAEEVAKIGPAVEHLAEETTSLRDGLAEEVRALRQTITEESRALRQSFEAESRSLNGALLRTQEQLGRYGWMIGLALLGVVATLIVALVTA